MQPSEDKQYVHLAGDKLSAASEFMTARGESYTLSYTGRYAFPEKEKLIECEVYREGDEIMIHTICVRCHKCQRVKITNKKFWTDKQRGLFSEPFTCPWELEGDRPMEFGLGLCGARVAYDGKVIKDA